MRGTLSLYYKHIVDNNHRENVKKLCDENRFVPSVYDQAIHLAFQNNVNTFFGIIINHEKHIVSVLLSFLIQTKNKNSIIKHDLGVIDINRYRRFID